MQHHAYTRAPASSRPSASSRTRPIPSLRSSGSISSLWIPAPNDLGIHRLLIVYGYRVFVDLEFVILVFHVSRRILVAKLALSAPEWGARLEHHLKGMWFV